MLRFQLVGSIEGSFVDCSTEFGFSGLAFSGRNDDVKCEEIIDLEFDFLNMLVGCLTIEDDSVAVDEVFLHFVGEDAFNCGALVGGANLLDDFGDIRVVLPGFQEAEGCLDCFVGCKDCVCFAVFGLLLAHDDGVADQGDEAVNVAA